jgi:hypothetical protein
VHSRQVNPNPAHAWHSIVEEGLVAARFARLGPPRASVATVRAFKATVAAVRAVNAFNNGAKQRPDFSNSAPGMGMTDCFTAPATETPADDLSDAESGHSAHGSATPEKQTNGNHTETPLSKCCPDDGIRAPRSHAPSFGAASSPQPPVKTGGNSSLKFFCCFRVWTGAAVDKVLSANSASVCIERQVEVQSRNWFSQTGFQPLRDGMLSSGQTKWGPPQQRNERGDSTAADAEAPLCAWRAVVHDAGHASERMLKNISHQQSQTLMLMFVQPTSVVMPA